MGADAGGRLVRPGSYNMIGSPELQDKADL
jgi:hypothetical protein